jgi:hypothetical protein
MNAPTLTPQATPAPAWLLLVHQLPTQPSNVRVKTWRRLQKLGAMPFKNSVYILPNTAQAREDLEWMKAEIVAMKGEAAVFAADSVDGHAHEEVVASFRAVRQRDFAAIRGETVKLLRGRATDRALPTPLRQRLERAARALRQRWTETAAIDFFAAPGGEDALASLETLERMLAPEVRAAETRTDDGSPLMSKDFQGRTWVTRPRPGIDRMGSAWLIRRFIDPSAEFRFAEKPEAASDGVPFDMYGVEFSHHGNACTFETLVKRFRVTQPAVQWLGKIVHDLDLRDERYALPDAPVVGRLVDGLRQIVPDDAELLERGMTLFEALYRSYSGDVAARKSASKQRARRKALK